MYRKKLLKLLSFIAYFEIIVTQEKTVFWQIRKNDVRFFLKFLAVSA